MKALGIDLGTSSAKLLCSDGKITWTQQTDYRGDRLGDFLAAVRDGLAGLSRLTNLSDIESIGLSGQTGSYILRDAQSETSISWRTPGREKYLAQVLSAFTPAEYLAMTGMAHPRLASYPAPTLLYLAGIPNIDLASATIDQPKDCLAEALCGLRATDRYSWRGLMHPQSGRYAPELLRFTGICESQLPVRKDILPLTRAAARAFGLREGIPVYMGLNDFYAALFSLRVDRPGMYFDVTGTSEHIGVTIPCAIEAPLICSPFLGFAVHYGVTASSGVALTWARKRFGEKEPVFAPDAPVFLPYLSGERAPVFDENATGLWHGITPSTDVDSLLYSAYEGVCFAAYDVYLHLGAPEIERILTTGGAANSEMINAIKASLFGVPVYAMGGGSAKGALMLAGGNCPTDETRYEPNPTWTSALRDRFRIYQRLYAADRLIREV